MTRKPDSDARRRWPRSAPRWSRAIWTTPLRSSAPSRACGACSPCRTPGRRASRRKRSRASASRRSRATRACSTSSTRRSARPTRDRHPALREQVPRRADGQQPRLPVVRDPAAGVLHGEPARAWFLGDKLVTALKPETKLQMVAVDDIGKFSAGVHRRRGLQERRDRLAGTPARWRRRPQSSRPRTGQAD